MFGKSEKILKFLNSIPKGGVGRFLSKMGLFLFFALPMITVLIWGAWWVYRDTTLSVVNSQKDSALLGRETMQERLEHLIDIGLALAIRDDFVGLVSEGKWEDAVQTMKDIPQDFPYIERVFLANKEGILTADTPHRPGVVGVDFSYRDWYRGVSENWQPYISHVYTREAQPQLNVVAVTIPVKAAEGEPLGILVLQIRLEAVADWARGIDTGGEGFIYFIDQDGSIVAHPHYRLQEGIIDYSSLSIVQDLIAGKSGTAEFYNFIEGEEQLAAYYPLVEYGWGVIAAQDTITAFAARNSQLSFFVAVGILATLIGIILTYLLIKLLQEINIQRVRQELFLQSIGDGVFVINNNREIIYFNRAAEKLSGYSTSEALHRPYNEVLKFVKEDTKEENDKFIKEALSGKHSSMEDSTVLVRKDNTNMPVADSAAPIEDKKGEIKGAVVVFRDETEAKEIEQIRKEMISLTSHQLKTPITHIRLYIETMQNYKMSKKAMEQLSAIDEVAANMFQMVKNMLNLAKLEQGDIKMQIEPVDSANVLEDVIAGLETMIKKYNVKLNFKKPKDILPKVLANEIFLSEVFKNLVSNAIKYAQGEVDLFLTQKEGKVLFECRDNGIGIPKKEQKDVFSKFFRATNAKQKEVEGTGLGLNIAEEIVKRFGGRVWFESEEGEGTTFYVELPTENS
ncbi:MAG: ATP-binding protein [Candidatus Spechtbacterales bacterium]|nr:ATP-binding protein [Candidatus Spechtbacterales bacterium]